MTRGRDSRNFCAVFVHLIKTCSRSVLFRKASRSVRELKEFEAVVNDLLRLEAMGYIDSCETLTGAHTGMRYVDRVFVRGGTTELGREALKNHP
jgi:hypothetical protein